MEWVFGGVLVVASTAITGFAGYLVWRLLTAKPAPGDELTGTEARGE
ncbi:MAG TPA: hypothetical protein VNA11_00240 [Pseudonocardia sp.]|nr:hypothetical protein [Pseudonocardia sp.]